MLMPLRSLARKKPDNFLIHNCQMNLTMENILLVSFIYLLGCTQGIWKFLGQGSNPCHSSDNAALQENSLSFKNQHFLEAIMEVSLAKCTTALTFWPQSIYSVCSVALKSGPPLSFSKHALHKTTCFSTTLCL